MEALAEAVGVSKSALGTYEAGDFKDISPFSIVKLAKLYGVTTDYLMGVSNLEKEADAEIQELGLTNKALDILKSGHFAKSCCLRSFATPISPGLMIDMEIFVDHIASMQVENLNYGIGMARSIVQKQYRPDDNELFYRTAELGTIPADEYVGSVLRDDLTGILRDIRKARPEKAKDDTDISSFAVVKEFQKRVQAVIEGEGSPEEWAAKACLAAWGIDYDSLTPEEFVVLIGILEKSKFKENSISQRGKKRTTSQKKRKK